MNPVGSTNHRGANRERLPLARTELRDAVSNTLRNLIFDGDYPAGTRLVETELADRFGTSRGPVRDALIDLEQSGLVVSTNRRGTFVRVLNAIDVEELYSLRSALESLAVRRAGERAKPDDLDQLDGILDELAAALSVGETRAAANADLRFHRSIVQLADHQRLLASWETLADQTQLLMQVLSTAGPEVQGDYGHHRNVLASLRAGDSEGAAALMRAHLAEATTIMTTHVDAPDE